MSDTEKFIQELDKLQISKYSSSPIAIHCYPRTKMSKIIPDFPFMSNKNFSNWLVAKGFSNGIQTITEKLEIALKELQDARNSDYSSHKAPTQMQGTFKVLFPIPNEPHNVLKIMKPAVLAKGQSDTEFYKQIMRETVTEYKIQNFLSNSSIRFIKNRVPSISDTFFTHLGKGKTKTTWVTIENNLYKKNEQEELFNWLKNADDEYDMKEKEQEVRRREGSKRYPGYWEKESGLNLEHFKTNTKNERQRMNKEKKHLLTLKDVLSIHKEGTKFPKQL